MSEPFLAERMGLPADFGFEHHLLSTLVFEDVTVQAPHHGNSFGLLLMRTIIQHVFRCPDYFPPDHYKNSFYNLVFCWACPPQFYSMNGTLSLFGDPTAEAVARRAELWSKGMLQTGCLYSRMSASCICYILSHYLSSFFVFQFSFKVRFGVLSTDEKTARSNLIAHFSRLGFRSLAGAPLQIGPCQPPLHCKIHVTRHSAQDPKFACTAFQRRN